MRKRIQSMNDLAEFVRSQRTQLGISQIDAAGASGVGPRFIGDLENGKPTCQIGKVLHLLNMLGVEIELSTRQGDD